MNNEDLVLKMILDESGFSAGMDKAVKQLGKFDGQVENTGEKGGRSLGNIWTTFVGNFLASGATKIISTGIGLITSSVDGAINRVDTLNNSNRVFENMGFNAKETASTMDALKASIQGLPTPMDAAIKGVQLIASSTNDLGKSQEIFAALNNGILGFGGSTEMVDNAIIQLSQSFSNGKIDAQTWNSMINSGLGPSLNALAKQMGITTGEFKTGLSEGEISVEQFQDALINLNKNGGGGLKSLEQIAKDSTAGIKTGIANMKTAVVRGVANVITAFDDGLKGAGFGSISEIIAEKGAKFEEVLNKVAKAIPPLMVGAKELYNTLEPFAPLFVGLIASLATFTAVSKIQQTVTGITNAFNVWKTATEGVTIVQKILNATLLANPIALIATAVVGLTAGIVYLWKTNEGFRDAVTKIWNTIKETISNVAESVTKAWEGTKKFFSDLWSGISDGVTSGVENVKNAWNGFKEWFAEIWSSLKQIISDFVTTVLTPFEPMIQFFSDLWENVRAIAAAGWELIKTAVMGPILLMIDLITGDFTQFKEDLNMLWTNIKDNASLIYNAIKDTIIGYIKAVVETGKNLWTIAKDTAISLWTGTVEVAKNLWGNLKNTILSFANSIKDGAIGAWNFLKTNTINIFRGIVDGAVKAWSTMVQSVKDVVNSVIKWFDKLKDIDLLEAGKAVIDGFVKGLKKAWEKGKEFIGGIGDWIRDHKGPIEYDRKLLVDNGKAIMDGLKNGIVRGFEDVKQEVSSIAGDLNDEFESEINPPVITVKSNKTGAFKPEVETYDGKSKSNVEQSGDVFNINLQSLGELSELQLMCMAEQLVKYIKDVKDREDTARGGAFGGI